MSDQNGGVEATYDPSAPRLSSADLPTQSSVRVWLDSVRNRDEASAVVLRIVSAVGIGACAVFSKSIGLRTVDSGLDSLVSLFAQEVFRIPEVERVSWRDEDATIRVWTMTDKPDRAVEDRIYDAQLDLMDRFPEQLFDFVVLFRQGRDPGGLVPEKATHVLKTP